MSAIEKTYTYRGDQKAVRALPDILTIVSLSQEWVSSASGAKIKD
jgi:hypothetical protein